MADALETLAGLPDHALRFVVEVDGVDRSVQAHLYRALRREQAADVSARADPEAPAILQLAQSAFRELEATLAGRPSAVLDTARDGEWSLRDLLRHAIAVELRYREQVRYSAMRHDDDPIAIPSDRLPCDRLAPPDARYADTMTASTRRVLELLAEARDETDVLLRDIPDFALERPSLWGTMTTDVRDRMHQIAAHLIEVTVQAEKMLGEAAEPEARRILRRIRAARGRHERSSSDATRSELDRELISLSRIVTGTEMKEPTR